MNACLPLSDFQATASTPEPALPSVLQLRSSAGLYGADRMLLTLNHALARRNVPSRLLSINNYRMPGQALHHAALAQAQDARLLPCSGRFDLHTLRGLIAEIDAGDAPLLHTHDYKSAFYAWMAARRRHTPLVATLHGWVDSSHSLRLYNRLELALLRSFDALVVVADAQVAPLLRGGIPRSRIHQIDNAIAFPVAATDSVASVRDAFGLGDARFVFGAVARLSSEKNLPILLEAFAMLAAGDPGVALLVAGEGPERSALEAQVGRLGLQQCVRFIGARADMERIYPALDCLVLPSLSEGMPLVVLEAMANALPIVATSVGDVPRLLANSDHGRVVAPGDLEALRAAMHAAASEPGRRDERARNHVLRFHSPAAMADRYLAVYQSLQVHPHGRTSS